jgi:hypothetical protein
MWARYRRDTRRAREVSARGSTRKRQSGEERARVRLPGGALLSARRASSELGHAEGCVGGPN